MIATQAPPIIQAPLALPASGGDDEKRQELAVIAGAGFASVDMAVIGAQYRFILNDTVSIRGAFETGTSYTAVNGVNASLSINRFSSSVVTNGMFYVGGGASLVSTTVVIGTTPSSLSTGQIGLQAIGGVRQNWGSLGAYGEARLGIVGGHSAIAGLAFRL